MKTKISVLFLLMGLLSLGEAREIRVGNRWQELRAKDGKIFWDVKFMHVSANEVRFMHTGGISTLQLKALSLSEDTTVSVESDAAAVGPLGSLMSAEERKRSGIDKLSPAEQAVLAKWMQQAVGRAFSAGKGQDEAQPATLHLPANASPTPAESSAVPAPGMLAENTVSTKGPATEAAAARPAAPTVIVPPPPNLLPPPAPVAAPSVPTTGGDTASVAPMP